MSFGIQKSLNENRTAQVDVFDQDVEKRLKTLLPFGHERSIGVAQQLLLRQLQIKAELFQRVAQFEKLAETFADDPGGKRIVGRARHSNRIDLNDETGPLGGFRDRSISYAVSVDQLGIFDGTFQR